MIFGLILTISITDWISSVSAFASLLTAIIALVTIKEIKKQREHSYFPDLNISNLDFYIYRCDKDEFASEEDQDMLYLYYSKTKIEETEPKKGYNDLKISMHNTGFGVAKSINYQWNFDFEAAKRIIESTDKSYSFEIEKDSISIKLDSLKVDWAYDPNEDNYGDFINFVLPYSVENRIIEINIPEYFIDLFWVYMATPLLADDFTGVNEPDDFPPLSLFISYTNIHGKVLKKEFLLFLRFSFIASPKTEESELAKLKLEIVEIKN